MKSVSRLLMAGTVLSSVVSIQMATAEMGRALEQSTAKPASLLMLAQAAAPDNDDKKKQEEKNEVVPVSGTVWRQGQDGFWV